MNPEDLLLADHNHFSESLWRNEEVGEKRFSFFMTLVTAVIAALVALIKSNSLTDKCMTDIVGAVVIALLIFGILTYFRMIQRNHVTDEYKKTLKYIRKRCVSLCDPDIGYYKVPRGNKTWLSKWLKGGYAETVGAINSILLGVLISVYSNINLILVLIISFVFFGLQWFLVYYVREFLSKKKPKTFPDQYFRAGVGAMIIDDTGRLLVLKRPKTNDTWQFPQGGLKEDEKPSDGILREILEETGISKNSLVQIDEYSEPLSYQLPIDYRSRKTGRGQAQYWFLFKFIGDDSEINISESDESIAWRWMTVKQILKVVVDFRSRVYKLLTKHYSKHLLHK